MGITNLRKNLIKTVGISHTFSEKLLSILGLAKSASKQLDSAAVINIKTAVFNKMEPALARQLIFFKNLKEKETAEKKLHSRYKTYKGVRYKKGMPVRGQRTHTNAQTAKKINKIEVDE